DRFRRSAPRPPAAHAALRQHRGGGGVDAPHPPQPRDGGDPHPRVRQGGVHEPRRQRQGPRGAGHHRGRRARGRAAPRRHRGGGDQRQHRGGAGAGRRHQGVPLHLHHPGQDEPGEGAAPQGVRGRGDRDAHRRGARPPRQLRDDGEADRRRDAQRHPRQPVLQPGQPRGPLRHHRPRDLGADGGAGDALRLGRGHRRHADGGGALPQGAQPRRPHHRRRPGGLHHRRVRGHGEQAGSRAVQGGGDRAGQDPRHAGHERGGRVALGGRPRVAGDGAPADPRGGAVRGRLGGADLPGGAGSGARDRRPGGVRRLHPVRHGRALPVQDLQRRVDEGEPAAGAVARDGARHGERQGRQGAGSAHRGGAGNARAAGAGLHHPAQHLAAPRGVRGGLRGAHLRGVADVARAGEHGHAGAVGAAPDGRAPAGGGRARGPARDHAAAEPAEPGRAGAARRAAGGDHHPLRRPPLPHRRAV
ncbi:MAG: Cystathionine beta-synthase, partial [uncultured Gemmatimonadetes bacterium]